MATKTKMQQPLTAPLAQRTDKLELARQALANSSLSIGAPGKSASTPSPLLSTTVLTIPIRDIGYYEKNPRTDPNESFEDIKESIRLAGLDSIMQVMRLPGATTYTVAKGGNTRLRALKELFEETRDPKFEQITAQLVPFKGHPAAIADHLKENTLRGAMSFFDRANGFLELQRQIEQESGKKPGVREMVKTLKEQYGLVSDPATLGRFLHVAEHFVAIKLWANQVTAKSLIPAYNNLLRLAIKFEKEEAEVHTELESALDRFGTRLAKESDAGSAAFNTDACIAEMQAGIAAFLGLTQYQLNYALAALETVPSATKAELMTTPATPVSAGLLVPHSSSGAADHDGSSAASEEDLSGSSGSGSAASGPAAPPRAPSGAKTPHQIALELAQQTKGAGSGTPAGGTAEEPVLQPSGAASVPQGRRPAHATTVEDALDKVIDAVAQFADACGIGETCKTSLSLPSGYVMEIPDEELTLPTDGQADSRIRVAGWWMAAALARQYDEEHCRLLPADSVWRAAWVRDEQKLESSELFQVIQSHLGAVMGDDGSIALGIEYVHVLLSDPKRAGCYFALVESINQLASLRNGGRQ